MKRIAAHPDPLLPVVQAMKRRDFPEAWRLVREMPANAAGRKKMLVEVLTQPRFAAIAQAAAEPYARLVGDNALPLLWQCIRDPRNAKRRGGFVYAMWRLDWSGYWNRMVDLTVDTSFEVRDLARHAILIRWKRLPMAVQRNIHRRLIEFCYDESIDDEPRRHMLELLRALNRRANRVRREQLRAAS